MGFFEQISLFRKSYNTTCDTLEIRLSFFAFCKIYENKKVKKRGFSGGGKKLGKNGHTHFLMRKNSKISKKTHFSQKNANFSKKTYLFVFVAHFSEKWSLPLVEWTGGEWLYGRMVAWMDGWMVEWTDG